eukprot:gene6737-3406_t
MSLQFGQSVEVWSGLTASLASLENRIKKTSAKVQSLSQVTMKLKSKAGNLSQVTVKLKSKVQQGSFTAALECLSCNPVQAGNLSQVTMKLKSKVQSLSQVTMKLKSKTDAGSTGGAANLQEENPRCMKADAGSTGGAAKLQEEEEAHCEASYKILIPSPSPLLSSPSLSIPTLLFSFPLHFRLTQAQQKLQRSCRKEKRLFTDTGSTEAAEKLQEGEEALREASYKLFYLLEDYNRGARDALAIFGIQDMRDAATGPTASATGHENFHLQVQQHQQQDMEKLQLQMVQWEKERVELDEEDEVQISELLAESADLQGLITELQRDSEVDAGTLEASRSKMKAEMESQEQKIKALKKELKMAVTTSNQLEAKADSERAELA